jgi:hypothetical protein
VNFKYHLKFVGTIMEALFSLWRRNIAFWTPCFRCGIEISRFGGFVAVLDSEKSPGRV